LHSIASKMKVRDFVLFAAFLAGCGCVSTPVPRAGFSSGFPSLEMLPPVVLQEVERQTFELVTTPVGLPEDVRSALATELRQSRLVIAAASEQWSSGCLPVPGLPRQHLVFAAVCSMYAVIE